MSERFEYLEHVLDSAFLRSNQEVSRADLDEIEFLIKSIDTELPDQFGEILQAFNSSENVDFGSSRFEVVERLHRLLKVTKKFPPHNLKTVLSEELLPTFKLDDDDKSQVLKLCEQMRKIVNGSDVLDDAHRRRLLRRISAIEYQVHQPKGIFDVIKGGVSDVGEVLGKFGEDIKPLTDRMTEISKIVRRNTGEYDELPPPEDHPRLPAPDHRDD